MICMIKNTKLIWIILFNGLMIIKSLYEIDGLHICFIRQSFIKSTKHIFIYPIDIVYLNLLSVLFFKKF